MLIFKSTIAYPITWQKPTAIRLPVDYTGNPIAHCHCTIIHPLIHRQVASVISSPVSVSPAAPIYLHKQQSASSLFPRVRITQRALSHARPTHALPVIVKSTYKAAWRRSAAAQPNCAVGCNDGLLDLCAGGRRADRNVGHKAAVEDSLAIVLIGTQLSTTGWRANVPAETLSDNFSRDILVVLTVTV